MSETKRFSEVPVATDSAPLLCVDAAGNVRRVNENLYGLCQKLSITTTAPEWVRLFSFSIVSVVFVVAKNYYSSPGGSIVVNASLRADGLNLNAIDIVSKALNNNGNNPFKKMRVLVNGNIGYLDIYHEASGQDSYYLNFLPSLIHPIQIIGQTGVDIPNGFTVKDIDISGGVTRRYSIFCNSEEKGGAHERRQEVERTADGCLTFESIDDCCRCLGELVQNLLLEPDTNVAGLLGCGRCPSRMVKDSFHDNKSSGEWQRRIPSDATIRPGSETTSVLSVRRRWPVSLDSEACEQGVAELETVSVCDLKDRKEVAV